MNLPCQNRAVRITPSQTCVGFCTAEVDAFLSWVLGKASQAKPGAADTPTAAFGFLRLFSPGWRRRYLNLSGPDEE